MIVLKRDMQTEDVGASLSARSAIVADDAVDGTQVQWYGAQFDLHA